MYCIVCLYLRHQLLYRLLVNRELEVSFDSEEDQGTDIEEENEDDDQDKEIEWEKEDWDVEEDDNGHSDMTYRVRGYTRGYTIVVSRRITRSGRALEWL